MRLPPPLDTYFEAQTTADADRMAATFAPGGVVRDEGLLHRGPGAIRAWWLAAKRQYDHVAEPLELSHADGRVVVRARVSGAFEGSPVVLDFAFRLSGGRIAELEVR
ncbi:hypothetical protein DLJ53_11660 [Acuticoccus sediminis]|uniref:SnoaL-like domain-containing protein n=1 Tax=Acuticoccus sediminis TaxID=2184697 RepID=A0A8B2NU50_9HYPH|nr:nuclear transport factor 2 family protein [Acuticoccus sediminis]RAI02029.1 hypothetical protein DLJ53_11660 [Acuticoccus sediminis]